MRKLGSFRRGSYAFGRFQLSADGTLLVREGLRVALAPKALQTLLVLVERAGQVVTKADLLQEVWPDCFVEETGLARNISLLRQALGDDSRTLIVTVARVGYRFAAPVVWVDAPAAPPAATPPQALTAISGADAVARRVTRLVVVPFRLLRDDPEIAFLAFSVPDAVANALSDLASLVVRSSAAASRIAGDRFDLKQIATDADVDAVVTGTLVKTGDEIRVSAQLLAVPDGTVLWSEVLHATWRELFALQDRLVADIVRSLSLAITEREQRHLRIDVPASAAAYEFYLRGNECVGAQGTESSSSLRVARELYAHAVDHDPRFAPAWARLGRCHYLIGKADDDREQNLARAESCFQRALHLNPDLPLASNLYALLEVDQGRAKSAMIRLLARGLAGSEQPDLYAALVQACRFCGLLEASIAAHERARALDPRMATGGYQALWQLGDEDGALRQGIRPYVLEALTIGMRGDRARAVELLREREDHGPTGLLRHLYAGLRAVFEGRRDRAIENAGALFDAFPDPEVVYYAARYIAFFGEPRAVTELARALERGFVVYRVLLRVDPWLDPLRQTPAFQSLLAKSRHAYRECLKAYADAHGERLLGRVPGPEELEGVVLEESRSR